MKYSDSEVHKKILDKLGCKVSFKYPGLEEDRHGILKDRCVIKNSYETGIVPYFDVVDLIEFKGEKEPLWIRFGYFRNLKTRLVWGSQTTITEPLSIWKQILVKTAKEKEWFHNLLNEVYKEINQVAE